MHGGPDGHRPTPVVMRILPFLQAHHWDGSKRIGVTKLFKLDCSPRLKPTSSGVHLSLEGQDSFPAARIEQTAGGSQTVWQRTTGCPAPGRKRRNDCDSDGSNLGWLWPHLLLGPPEHRAPRPRAPIATQRPEAQMKRPEKCWERNWNEASGSRAAASGSWPPCCSPHWPCF